MQKFALAKTLSTKAENFITEGNYEYASRCYDKIITILRQLIGQATSKETIEQLKNKILKFQTLKVQAETKGKAKMMQASKPIGFGFPTSAIRVPTQPLQKDKVYIKMTEPQRKPIFRKEIDDPVVNDVLVRQLDVSFKDIVGLGQVKSILEQAVIRPRQRPDLYTGIRAPPRALLLYGPPGNGKTYICKALAKECKCAFLALSASCILNKLVGQSQKTLKRIFQGAEKLAPAIIFIDQIDSMLTARSENENDAARRLKTEFLVLMDGVNSPKSGDVLLIGATNLPAELDPAAKRRFSKMIYIPHPDAESRQELILKCLKQVQYDLSKGQINKIVDKLQYFSAAQIRNIVAQACMGPLRELEKSQFQKIQRKDLRKVSAKDLLSVIADRKPIVCKEQLAKYKEKL